MVYGPNFMVHLVLQEICIRVQACFRALARKTRALMESLTCEVDFFFENQGHLLGPQIIGFLQ